MPNPWQRWGLGRRWLTVSIALVLAMQLLVYWLAQGVIHQKADLHLQKELQTAERVMSNLLARDASRLHEGAVLLAANHVFRSALARGDMPAMQAALDSEGAHIGASITAVLDRDMRMQATNSLDALFLFWIQSTAYPEMARASAFGASSAQDTDMAQLADRIQSIAGLVAQNRARSTLVLLGDAPFQFVITPVMDAHRHHTAAWVLMGFALRPSLAAELQGTLDVQVGLVAARTDGAPQWVFDTLGERRPAPGLPLAAKEVWLQDERFVLRQQAVDAVGGEVRLLFMRSHATVMAPFNQLLFWLALISLAALLLFAWASVRSVRRITAPLGHLQQATRALADGRFDVSWPLPGGQDEVAQLSRSFERMRLSLGEQQAEMRRLAYRDRLTGLPNRQRFVQAVEEALCHPGPPQQPQILAVLTLNIDRFKHVNEVLGYAFGDELLKAVAQRLGGGATEDEQLLARLGGDEFGLLLPGKNAEQAGALAQALQDRLGQGVELNGQLVDVRVSIGVAEGPRDASSADTLVNRAEMAMRWAKRRRAGILSFLPVHDTACADSLSLLGELRQGLARGEMQLYLQPKVALHGSAGVSAEALVRWLHPQQGLVPPGRFIPFAEQTGFISELTHWMIDAVARQCAEWRRNGLACTVAVNVSARDLLDERFAHRVQGVLAQHGVPATDLTLELTESALMDEPARVEATLRALADIGVALAIDDFGTGFSSLSYLKRLPVQVLKIDQAFVRDVLAQPSDAVIVRSTIDMAHALGLEVVAEGVENAGTLEQLQAWRCDWAQGYHMAAPMPAQAFSDLLKMGGVDENAGSLLTAGRADGLCRPDRSPSGPGQRVPAKPARPGPIRPRREP